jgi:hypothetical protein
MDDPKMAGEGEGEEKKDEENKMEEDKSLPG